MASFSPVIATPTLAQEARGAAKGASAFWRAVISLAINFWAASQLSASQAQIQKLLDLAQVELTRCQISYGYTYGGLDTLNEGDSLVDIGCDCSNISFKESLPLVCESCSRSLGSVFNLLFCCRESGSDRGEVCAYLGNKLDFCSHTVLDGGSCVDCEALVMTC
jgi:hypothetical protein